MDAQPRNTPNPLKPPRAGVAVDTPEPPGIWEYLQKVLWRVSIAAFGVSIFIHALGWLFSALIGVGGSGDFGAPGSGSGRSVGAATVTTMDLGSLPAGLLDSMTPMVPEAVQESTDAGLLEATGESGGSPGLGVGDLPAGTGMGGAGDVGIGSGDGLGGSGGSGGGGASFFGVEASGKRFAYIVDVSGSMATGAKIDQLRAELIKSVSEMAPNNQFLIVPFSDIAEPLGRKDGWTEANESGKRWMRREVARLDPQAGTHPLSGFEQVFRIRPRPDAIFFMTDGEFDEAEADKFLAMNRDPRVPIHTICLETQGSEPLMLRIARESGGTYRFVSGPRK